MSDNKTIYRNHQHYIAEGWLPTPKFSFLNAMEIITQSGRKSPQRVLDVGCATGEFINFLKQHFNNSEFVGVDVSEELIAKCEENLPSDSFFMQSVLNLDESLGTFDVVCAMGCMSIFNDDELTVFWKNLIRVCSPDGLIIVFAPLNSCGVDALISHRKRMQGKLGEWEKGWNIFSLETVTERIKGLGYDVEIERFKLPIVIERKDDPIRTWTHPTNSDPLQLINGLQLFIDHFFIVVDLKHRDH